MTKGIYDSRAKDYNNPFRKMVYTNAKEMAVVTGSLEQNSFIRQEIEMLAKYKKELKDIIGKMKL